MICCYISGRPFLLALSSIFLSTLLCHNANAFENGKEITEEVQTLPGGGRIHNPVASPSNPDIIAYTRQIDNKAQLYFFNIKTRKELLITGEPEEELSDIELLFSDFDSDDQETLSFYEGDLVWRPVLDQFGMQWFAFTTSQSGKHQLSLGFLACEDSLLVELFDVEFGQSIATPAFSPDGSKLVFVNQGELYLERNITTIVRNKDISLMNPLKITDNPEGNFFPSWSHDSRFIAYQRKPLQGPRQGYESIFLIDVSGTGNPDMVPVTHLISDINRSGNQFNHMRPAWAPDDHVLAFYEVRNVGGRGDQVFDIRVLQVVQDRANNRYFGELPERHRDNVFERRVVPAPRNGPNWVSLNLGRRSVTGLLFVRFDPDLFNPLYLSSYHRYIRQQDALEPMNLTTPRPQTGQAFLYPTTNNLFPTAVQSNGHTRLMYVYHDPTKGAHQIQMKDIRSDLKDVSIKRDIHRGKVMSLAAVYPGLGHYYIGEKKRALIVGGAFTALSLTTASFAVSKHYNLSKYYAPNETLISMGVLIAGLWAANMYDIHRIMPSFRYAPVNSSYKGYLSHSEKPGHSRSDAMNYSYNRWKALSLSGVFPGMGHFYIDRYMKGSILAGTFSVFAGSAFVMGSIRVSDVDNPPSKLAFSGALALAAGTWAFSVGDIYRLTFRSPNLSGSHAADNARAQIHIAPEMTNILDQTYFALGVSIPFSN